MKIIAIIHRTPRGNAWAYDIYAVPSETDKKLLKIAEDILKILNDRIEVYRIIAPYEDECCYRLPASISSMYKRNELICVAAGDTLSSDNPQDLEGILNFIKQAFKPDEVYIEEVG